MEPGWLDPVLTELEPLDEELLLPELPVVEEDDDDDDDEKDGWIVLPELVDPPVACTPAVFST